MLEFHWSKGQYYVLENPMSSILWRYKCIARILKRHKAQRVVVHLGCFGASTMKPVPRIATTERFSLDVGLCWMISVAENVENQSFFLAVN